MATADVFLEWGQDLVLDPYGGIALAYGWDQARQELERLILTNFAVTEPSGQIVPADYLWHPQYGLGTRALIGQPRQQTVIDQMKTKIKQAISVNPVFAKSPAPVVQVVPIPPAGVQIFVQVWMADGTPGRLALQIDK